MLRQYEDKMVRGYEDKSQDSVFVLMASGPSLTEHQVEYCKKKAKILVVNDNYRIAPWADYHYACDQHWWLWHEDDPVFLNFKGQKYTQSESWEQENLDRMIQKHGVHVIQSKSNPGLSKDQNFIHQGSNSGYQAINLAYHLGARKIILIGYDMQPTNGQWHWFGNHPTQLKSPFDAFIRAYECLAQQLDRYNLEIINCTIETALTCFPRKKLEEVL